jgi:putative ABC transport system permease protein
VEGIKNPESLVSNALGLPGITQASWCTSLPPRIWGGDTFVAEGKGDQGFPMNYTSADEHYLQTLDIRLRYGRYFSSDIPGDSSRVILNEATVLKTGWANDESVLGKKLIYDNNAYEVIGVVSDFNYWSLTTPIEPLGIFHIKNKRVYPGDRQYLALRVQRQSKDEWQQTITSVNNLWKQHAGDAPFDYYFVDQAFAQTFKSQQQFGNILTVMSALAIMIACLGLLAMIIFSIEHRSKEIGIRKVNGAGVLDILKLVTGSFSKLVLIAFIIGAPCAYWMMTRWLEGFAYKISPSFLTFAIVGSGTLLVAILITGYHSMKAASLNPVDVLKDE